MIINKELVRVARHWAHRSLANKFSTRAKHSTVKNKVHFSKLGRSYFTSGSILLIEAGVGMLD